MKNIIENSLLLSKIKECRNSCFSMNNYSVSIELKNFVSSMLLHTWYEKSEIRYEDISVSNNEWIKRVTPSFQRANNKWNKNMKLKFIENVLKGAKTELLFFRMNEQDDAQIIDGLQRTTAIIDFFNGKIEPFGYNILDIKQFLNHFNTNITIKIYTFKEWRDVGRFYIDMNENITHSKKDIDKCKSWFESEKGILL